MSVCISRETKSIFYLPICAILIITSYRELFSLIEANSFLDPVSSEDASRKPQVFLPNLNGTTLNLFLISSKAVPTTPVLRPLPHDTHLPRSHYPYHPLSHEGMYSVLLSMTILSGVTFYFGHGILIRRFHWIF